MYQVEQKSLQVDAESSPSERNDSKIWLYLIVGILGLYGIVLTGYTAHKHMREPASQSIQSQAQRTESSSTSKPSTIEEKPSPKKKSEENEILNEPQTDLFPNLEGQLGGVMSSVFSPDELGTAKKGVNTLKELLNPSAIVMNALTSAIVTVASVFLVVGLGYLAYRSTYSMAPLLPVQLVQTIQNYTRLAAAIAGGALLIFSLIVYFDKSNMFGGLAHVSAIFFASIAVLSAFVFTFSELALSAQTVTLPTLEEGLFSGKTAQTLMSWSMTFLQINMQTLASGLFIMWIGMYAGRWVLKAAAGSKIEKVCGMFALPLTMGYMSAKKSAGLIHQVFRIAFTILSFALTINLITPDKV